MAFYPDTEGGAGVQITFVSHIGCRAARKVVKRCIRRRHVPGWRVIIDNSGTDELRRGSKRIRIKGTAGGAPHCTAAAAGGAP